MLGSDRSDTLNNPHKTSRRLPFYTIWQFGTAAYLAFAVLHCTIGDVLITAGSLGLALAVAAVFGTSGSRLAIAVILTVLIGVGYTVFSEWYNVYIRQSWAYSARMPTIQIGKAQIGLSPMLQWIVVPALAAAIVCCRMARLRVR